MARHGHVFRALKKADVVLDVRDIRYPRETKWEPIERLQDAHGFERVIALTKADLVPREEAERIKRELEREEGCPVVYVSGREGKGIRVLRRTIYEVAEKAGVEEPITVAVIGPQNVGKSTIVNALARRKAAPRSPKAGQTRGVQRIRASKRLAVLDTPGTVPVEETVETAEAVVLDPSKLEDPRKPAVRVLERVKKEYPGALEERFGVDEGSSGEELLSEIAERTGWDEETVARVVLREWVDGSLVERVLRRSERPEGREEPEGHGTVAEVVRDALREVKEVHDGESQPSAAFVRDVLIRRALLEPSLDGKAAYKVDLGDYEVGVAVGDRYHDRMYRKLRRMMEGEPVSEERLKVGREGRKAVVLVTRKG